MTSLKRGVVLTAGGTFLLEDTFFVEEGGILISRKGSSISGSRGSYFAGGGVHFDLEEGVNIIWSRRKDF